MPPYSEDNKQSGSSSLAGNTDKPKVWLAIGDIHGDLDNLKKLPIGPEVSGIIIHGDMTNEGTSGDAEKIINRITASGIPVLAQIGNMDLLEVNDWLEQKNINLHGHAREISPQAVILGIGGSTFTPMHTPTEFSEEEYSQWLRQEWSNARAYPCKILVSHNPPRNTKCDDLGNGVHVGSRAVREFIDEYQPELCVCGHIHEARGIDRLGKTLIINPGAFADGGYVKIVLNENGLAGSLENINA